MKVRPSGGRTEELLEAGESDNDSVDGVLVKELEESLRLIEDLKFFLATAPVNWQENQIIRRYYLNNDQGFVSCVFWNNLYYITGTDIVKCCMYRMQKFGREVVQKKKFEEGIFSDLRNLKCGVDATLEPPKSEFLSFLFRNLCLKTQKKQKVFFWFSVPHDKLFADALERDLKRESLKQPSTTTAVADPALSFNYDIISSKSLNEQLNKYLQAKTEQLNVSPTDSNRMMIQPQDMKLKTEEDTKSPLKGMMDTEDFNLQLNSSTDTQQDDMSSPDTSANFVPQKLVVEPSNLELNNERSGILKDTAITIDDSDRGDFPLDYFPVEIEYPNHDREMEPFTMRSAMSHLPPFYDNRQDEEVVRPTATFAVFPPYPMQTPYAMPMSSTRSHFMPSGKVWGPQVRERSPSPISKDSSFIKYSDHDDPTNYGLDEHSSSFSDHMQQQYQQSQSQYYNAYSKAYNNGYYGYYPQAADTSMHSNETMSYGYDEFFPAPEAYDQGYFLPQEPPNWNFVPPQAMQPPTSATGFITRPFTPGYRSAPVNGRTPFISMAQGGWQQHLASPYGSKETSATSKTYPSGTLHQPSSLGPRRPPYNASTPKSYLPKHGKIAKPIHRKTNSQHKQQPAKVNPKTKLRTENFGETKSTSQTEKRRFSIPTPESNSLVVQADDEEDSELPSEDFLNNGIQTRLQDLGESE